MVSAVMPVITNNSYGWLSVGAVTKRQSKSVSRNQSEGVGTMKNNWWFMYVVVIALIIIAVIVMKATC